MENQKTNSITIFLLTLLVQWGEGIHPSQMAQFGLPPADTYIPLTNLRSSNASSACTRELEAMITTNNTQEVLLKVMTFIDATGREGGFMHGDLAWLGSYDECETAKGMHYCLANLFITPPLPQLNNQTQAVKWGICLVKECGEADIASILDTFLKDYFKIYWMQNVTSASVQCASHPVIPYTPGFYITITIAVIFIVCCIVGTLIDTWVKYNNDYKPKLVHRVDDHGNHVVNPHSDLDENSPLLTGAYHADNALWEKPPSVNRVRKLWGSLTKFFLCFSLPANCGRMLNTKTSDDTFSCLNGIRVLSIMWVILGHSWLFAVAGGIMDNGIDILAVLKRWSFQAVSNAYFSVDSFFFLSGLLVCYLTLKTMEAGDGKLPLFKFYFHRWWRLTPVMMFVILFYHNVLPHMADGPVWKTGMIGQRQCSDKWWTNLLYINNFYPDSLMKECLSWSWYLANDMQFFIVSPIIIVTIYKSRKVGLLLACCVIASCCVVTAILMAVYDLRSMSLNSLMRDILNPPAHDYQSVVYVKPYCRISPYVVGMIVGYWVLDQKGEKKRINKLVVILGWAVATAAALSVLYGLYSTYHGHVMDLFESILYESFSRLVWSLSLAWMVLMCYHGYGGWVNTILSWKFWIPLGRVTYLAYLLHPIVIVVNVFSARQPIHVSDSNMIFYFISWTVVTYLCSFTLSVFMEFPLANIERLLFKMKRT